MTIVVVLSCSLKAANGTLFISRSYLNEIMLWGTCRCSSAGLSFQGCHHLLRIQVGTLTDCVHHLILLWSTGEASPALCQSRPRLNRFSGPAPIDPPAPLLGVASPCTEWMR